MPPDLPLDGKTLPNIIKIPQQISLERCGEVISTRLKHRKKI
jgi:hypothetical protein